jgi:hypothetical protein
MGQEDCQFAIYVHYAHRGVHPRISPTVVDTAEHNRCNWLIYKQLQISYPSLPRPSATSLTTDRLVRDTANGWTRTGDLWVMSPTACCARGYAITGPSHYLLDDRDANRTNLRGQVTKRSLAAHRVSTIFTVSAWSLAAMCAK